MQLDRGVQRQATAPKEEGIVEFSWSLILPLLVLQLVLSIAALADLWRREPERVRGPKWAWGLVSIFVATLGPIAYFIAGRKD